MLKSLRILTLIALIGAGTTAVAAAKAPPPKISKARAEAMALKLAPGKITDAE